MTEAELKQDPLSGSLFVFVNRRRDRIKILYWGETGFCIWYQQLQQGTYQLPRHESLDEQDSLEVTRSQLSLILDGIDLASARQRRRFQLAREVLLLTEFGDVSSSVMLVHPTATLDLFKVAIFFAEASKWSCAIRFVLHNDAHRDWFTEDALRNRRTDRMTLPRPELPSDIGRCHAVIEQLHARLQQVTQQASLEARDAAARIAHLEALLAEHKETIADQQQTIENLAADNELLKRSLFGSRRERYDDPAQALLFDLKSLKPEPAKDRSDEDSPESTEPRRRNEPARAGSDASFPTSCHGKKKASLERRRDPRGDAQQSERASLLQESGRTAGADPHAAEGD